MASTPATDETQIRALLDGVSEALRAKDAGRLMSHYAADAALFALAPPLRSTGHDPERIEAWFATWQGPIILTVHDLNVAAGGDTAFCHGLGRMRGTKTDGETPELWFRLTVCFRKSGGRWSIVHEHESVPFYMDGSVKAAVDLRP